MFAPEDLKTEPWPKPIEGIGVHKTPVGVRVTHIPTGLAVMCADERSMHLNRDKALEKLERIVKGFERH